MAVETEPDSEELSLPLQELPPVDFCCVYGSSLLPQTTKSHQHHSKLKPMTDYILGVSDPLQWHNENLLKNRDHYASWTAFLGARTVTQIADVIGVGLHFNPFVRFQDKTIKYGVVRMHDLVQDLLNWDTFYISGRLQKPVRILFDSMDLEDVNTANIKGAISAALLFLPPEFTEEELYHKVCSLSYMGDVRMTFAEDKDKVKSLVNGRHDSFRALYLPILREYDVEGILTLPSASSPQAAFVQDCSLSASAKLVSSIPKNVRRLMGAKLGEKRRLSPSGRVISEVVVKSRDETARCMQNTLRRLIKVSSTRQAVAGFLSAGKVNAVRYLANKMSKAWRSRR